MNNTSALMDTVSLSLLQNIREGMQSGRIDDMKTAQAAVEAAIDELLFEGATQDNDSLVRKLLLQISLLHGRVARCESQLAEFQECAETLKEETAQISASTEACDLLVTEQQKVRATMEEEANISTIPAPCPAPAPSATDPTLHPVASKMAVISFPGGPRTVTIHPPGSPDYQPIICDEKGDVIITFKSARPLRREGAFRGSLEDIDWREIHRVCGRGPEAGGSRPAAPALRWPNPSQPSPRRRSSRGPSDIIARQRQLSMSMQTDAFVRLLPPDYLIYAKSPSLPTGMSSSSDFPDSLSSWGAFPDVVTTHSLTPSSPCVRKGKKRAWENEKDEGAPSTRGRAHHAKEPVTPTPVQREESHPPEERVKRKKLRSSASSGALAARPVTRSQNVLDLTRTV